MSKSSKNRIRLLTALVLSVSLILGMSITAFAATVDREKKATLTIVPQYGSTEVMGGTFQLYKVAEIASQPQLLYKLTGTFEGSNVLINAQLNTVEKHKKAAADLWGMLPSLTETEKDAVVTVKVEENNTVSGLELGAYLVVQTSARSGYRASEPFLVLLPTPGANGWSYEQTIHPKQGQVVIPDPEDPDPVSVTVEKLWEDAGNEANRPAGVTMQLYRDGEATGQTVTLSQSNGWSHTWTGLDANGTWTVEEENVPLGYTAFAAREDNVFTITNIFDDGVPLGRTTLLQKQWEGDSEGDRPATVEVSLYRDGELYETVTLTAEGGWAYSWIGLPSGHLWTVEEVNVAEGYTATVDSTASGFVVTNTRTPGGEPQIPGTPGEPGGETPGTPGETDGGDAEYTLGEDEIPQGVLAPETGMLQWPVPVLAILGGVLVGSGLLSGRGKKTHGK